MKGKRTWIWILLAAVVIAGAVAGVMAYSRANRDPVFVYGFADGTAGMTDYHDYSNESSGMVTTDRVQNVFLSDTQTVLEVMVIEGQQVKKGDVLFTYDTTLSNITLMQKEISVQRTKLDLETAKKELQVINSYVPIRYIEVEQPEETEPAEPVADLAQFDLTGKDYLAYSGSGTTSLTPKYCWLRSETMVDEAMIQALFEGMEGDVLFLRFQYTAEDKADGAIEKEYGIKVMRVTVRNEKEDGEEAEIITQYPFTFFTPVTPQTAPSGPQVEWNSGFTATEIANMRKEKQEQIKDLEFQVKMVEAEYKIMQKEADSGQVLAEFDGTVVGLMDPESAAMQGMPLLKVSGGGGFYVEGTVSELELGNIALGQTVDVMSWDTGMNYEGTIVEIAQFPVENDGYYYGGVQNVSYYNYRVFIDESAQLQDGFYVSMTLRGAEGAGSLYINSAFVRTEGAVSYVYVRNGAGLLEKRVIQVGGSLWGSYTQVRSGLTGEDWVAFPYGNQVAEGAPTQEGTWEDLYSY